MKSIHHSGALSLSKLSRPTFQNNEWKKIVVASLEYEKTYITTNKSIAWIGIESCLLSESLETCHCMLIIVGAKLTSTVARELNYKSRCYSSGSLIGDTFKIPPNCELVILSQNYLEMFIGKEILTGLGRTFTMTDKPTLDLIGTDFMQQICSCLMF
eukprot:jgi/Galph1/2290/GphlegSOOS_G933.1